MDEMTPREIVAALDRHIIGQVEAKRAVAIALRNRWRRQHLDEKLRGEVTPKNILMIGPTGVGKTEIARRLARLTGAPFIKVEATKFTEVGYVGRDVESIVRDLSDSALKMLREQALQEVQVRAREAAESRVLDALLATEQSSVNSPEQMAVRRRELLQKLRSGKFDKTEVKVKTRNVSVNVDVVVPPGMEEMTRQLQGLFSNLAGQKQESVYLPVAAALQRLQEEEAGKMINRKDLQARAVELTEENGIVFIDEIDKVTHREGFRGADVSREGVQRDLLPLIEGCTVKTPCGMVRTDHILFIASGAFHLSKPSDLVPELQGRLPIRVELDALGPEDFQRILLEPEASLTEQYQALLATEGLQLKFTQAGIQRIAEIAWQINENTENIGARRLHTVMERLLENISYDAPDQAAKGGVTVDTDYVDQHLAEVAGNEDLSRFIL